MRSNRFESGDVNITGNGNAVGNRVKVTNVHKTVINNRGGSGGSGGSDRGEEDKLEGAAILGMGLGALIALAALSFWFTRYSTLIYAILTATSVASGVGGVLAAARQIYVDEYAEGLRSFAVAAIAVLTFFIVSTAADTMPHELVERTFNVDFKTFWCGLSPFGQQVALQHSILGTFILAPLGVLTFLQSWRSFMLAVFGDDETPEWVDTFFELVSGERKFVSMCVVCAFGVLAHSQVANEFWKERFNSRIDFFCASR